MKLKTIKIMALALAGAALITASASAQLTYNDGELLLDFRATSGQGAGTNFEIDLGAADSAQFASGTVNLNLLLTAAQSTELTTLYGSNTNVVWSVGGGNIGTLGGAYSNGSTFFATQSGVPGNLASNVVPNGQAAQSNIMSGASGPTATTIDPTSITIANADSSGNSYFQQLTATNGQYFSLPITNPEASYIPGASLQLYAFQPNAALNGSPAAKTALATFTFGAVPEPSTYVLMLGGLIALVALKRRNSASTL